MRIWKAGYPPLIERTVIEHNLSTMCLVKMVPLGLVLGGLVMLFLLRSLYRKKISELSLTAELSKIGIPRGETQKIKGTAVICGGR